MPHAAPAIGTRLRRPAIGAESSTSTLNCSGAAASGRNAAQSSLFVLRFLSKRLPPDHAQPSRARPYFAPYQVRSLVYRLQVRHWHGRRAHLGAGLTAAQGEHDRHRSVESSPSSRSAAAEGARTASQLAPHSPAPDTRGNLRPTRSFHALLLLPCAGGDNRSRQRAVAARHSGGFGTAGAEGLATGRAGRFRGGGALRSALCRRGECMSRVAGVQGGQFFLLQIWIALGVGFQMLLKK